MAQTQPSVEKTTPRKRTTRIDCPRCGKQHPSNRSSLSRTDNRSLVCASCGREEGMLVYYGATLPPVEDWPLTFLDGLR